MKSFSERYKEAGVDITAGYRAVELMKSHIARTMTSGAMSDIGGFGGFTLGGLASFLTFNKSLNMPIMQVSQQLNFIVMAMAGARYSRH